MLLYAIKMAGDSFIRKPACDVSNSLPRFLQHIKKFKRCKVLKNCQELAKVFFGIFLHCFVKFYSGKQKIFVLCSNDLPWFINRKVKKVGSQCRSLIGPMKCHWILYPSVSEDLAKYSFHSSVYVVYYSHLVFCTAYNTSTFSWCLLVFSATKTAIISVLTFCLQPDNSICTI